jgi:uncharacterized protein DUF4340
VARAKKSFLDSVQAPTSDYRDRSFSRLGFGEGKSVDVQLDPAHYKLEKAGRTWDVVKGERHPADGEKVAKLLELVRDWHTEEFHDQTKPEDAGIDGKKFVDIDLGTGGKSGGRVTLLFGNRQGEKTIYAQRKEDGAVELVDAAPYDAMVTGGAEQFLRGEAIKWDPEFVEHLAREAGTDDEGQKIQSFVIERNLDGDKTWRSTGPAVTGKLDAQWISDVLAALSSVKTVEWLPHEPKDNTDRGFLPPKAATLTLEVHFGKTVGPDVDQKLYVGKKRPQGGYFARIGEHGGWAFILPEETVKLLEKQLTND